MNNPMTPPRSYQMAGRPSAKILPPATNVAEPPMVVAVSVAVNGKVFKLRFAKKKLVCEVIFFFVYMPINVIRDMYAVMMIRIDKCCIVNQQDLYG